MQNKNAIYPAPRIGASLVFPTFLIWRPPILAGDNYSLQAWMQHPPPPAPVAARRSAALHMHHRKWWKIQAA
jgi:hypothetical protein